MIAEKTTDVRSTGTLTGIKTDLGIDPAAMAHIMSVLTDLYSDPQLAVIREYSTNAWDAHVEAGIDRPIEVTLPSPLSPFLKVRDYGVGLSVEDIASIYSQYGASTKRGTNSQTGMLGLGCKSALTYAQQFTLVSVKDGKRVQVAITRESGGGSMTVVDERDTDEQNGTEIQVPARKDPAGGYSTLERTANEFFSYWPVGRVLVNGAQPATVWDDEDGFWLTKDILVRKYPDHDIRGNYRRSPLHRVVMGNVAYPLDNSRATFTVANDYEVISFVSIGDVNFVPSREALNYSDDKTVKRVEKLVTDFHALAAKAIQREIDSAKSKPEAIEKYLNARAALSDASSYGTYSYKGEELPTKFEVEGAIQNTYANNYKGNMGEPEYRMLSVPRRSYTQNQAQEVGQIDVASFKEVLWVTGYENKKFSAPNKQKLLKFIEARKDESAIQRFILLKNEPKSVKGWIDAERVVKWEDVNAIKIERAAAYGSIKNIPGSYENCIVDGKSVSELPANDIDQNHPIYTYTGSWYHVRQYMPLFDKFVKQYTIVPLPRNRYDKFVRTFPKAVKVDDAAQNLLKKWQASLSKDVKLAMAMGHDRTNLKVLDESKLDDPKLKAAVKVAKIDLNPHEGIRRLFQTTVGEEVSDTEFENPLDGYPLYNAHYMRYDKTHREHTYLYLNAAYAA